MKNKLLATLRESRKETDNYLEYCALLAQDFNMNLELVAQSPKILVPSTPEFVTVGPDVNTGFVQRKIYRYNERILEEKIEALSNVHPSVFLNHDIGDINERLEDQSIKMNAVLWTLNKDSNDNLINQLFGTEETEFSKLTELPCLNIPESTPYKKPKKIVIVVKDIHTIDIKSISQVIDRFSLAKVYIIFGDKRENSISMIMGSLAVSLRNFDGKIHTVAGEYDQAYIDRIVDLEQPDWIAFNGYNREFFERFYKINTNEIILKAEIPTIIF